MRAKHWGAFGLLGLVWGSSFLWIKLALREVPPFTLVGYRLLFGLAGMAMVVAVLRPRFPDRLQTWVALLLLGLTNTAIPFVLISWGEQSIDSAVASILNSTMPLFTLVIAHFALSDERITWERMTGLITGILGIGILVSGNLELHNFSGRLSGQLAVLAAAVCYAGSAVFARKALKGVHFSVQAAVPLVSADLTIWLAASRLEMPVQVPQIPITWIALLWLGLLGSCLAYLLYYYLLSNVGPTRTAMVTYLFPVVGVILGVLFLQEQLDWRLLAGGSLVLSGIVIVNGVKFRGRKISQSSFDAA